MSIQVDGEPPSQVTVEQEGKRRSGSRPGETGRHNHSREVQLDDLLCAQYPRTIAGGACGLVEL